MKLTQEQLEKYSRMMFLDEHDYTIPSIIHAEFDNDIDSLLYVLEYTLKNKKNLGFCRCFPTIKDRFRIDSMLRYRINYLQKQFSWTEKNKKRFLFVNDMLITSCKKAWNEAVKTAAALEERIKNNDSFIKDYEIEISFNVFPSFLVKDEEDEDELSYVAEYFSGKIDARQAISISHNSYEVCLDIDRPRDIDKKESYNKWFDIEEVFKDEYISYLMYCLLDSRAWSYQDILGINSIWADVQVFHQNYIELEPYKE